MSTIFIVIGVFNRLPKTRRCLSDLRRQQHVDIKVILVDGGSSDGTPDAVRKEFPEVDVIAPGKPLWWTEAMVVGVERALTLARPGDFVLSLNNDVEIDDPLHVSKLVSLSESNNRALTGAFCWKNRDKSAMESCGGWAKWSIGMLLYSDMLTSDEEPLELDFLVGRVTLIPIEVFDKIGNYDAIRFPQYYSDPDFTLRAKAAGFRVMASRDITLFHAEETISAALSGNALSYAEAWRRLTGIGSSVGLPQKWRFLKKHCPRTRLPIAAAMMIGQAMLLTVMQTFPLSLVGAPLLAVINGVWRRGAVSSSASASASRG